MLNALSSSASSSPDSAAFYSPVDNDANDNDADDDGGDDDGDDDDALLDATPGKKRSANVNTAVDEDERLLDSTDSSKVSFIRRVRLIELGAGSIE